MYRHTYIYVHTYIHAYIHTYIYTYILHCQDVLVDEGDRDAPGRDSHSDLHSRRLKLINAIKSCRPGNFTDSTTTLQTPRPSVPTQ